MKASKLLVVAIGSALLALSLVGCGGGGGSEEPAKEEVQDTRTDMVWYKVQIPEGFEIDDYNGPECRRANLVNSSDERQTVFFSYERSKTPDAALENELSVMTGRTQGEDIVTGDRTWITADYMWDGDRASVNAFTQVGEGSVRVSAHCLGRDDPALMTILESIEFPEDIDKAYADSFDVIAPGLEAKE